MGDKVRGFGMRRGLGVAQSWAGVRCFVCGQVSFDDARGLTSSRRNVGKCEGTFDEEDGHARVARKVVGIIRFLVGEVGRRS